jgi:hypothetical protein
MSRFGVGTRSFGVGAAALPPDPEAVLAHVVPAASSYIALTREQNEALRDEEGRLALDLIRHFSARGKPLSTNRRRGSGRGGRVPEIDYEVLSRLRDS